MTSEALFKMTSSSLVGSEKSIPFPSLSIIVTLLKSKAFFNVTVSCPNVSKKSLPSKPKASICPSVIWSVEVSLKPSIRSLPSPAAYCKRTFEPVLTMESSPLPPMIVELEVMLEMVSSSSPALIKRLERARPLVTMESLPSPPSTVR